MRRSAVRGIQRKELGVVRSLTSPPDAVKLALEAVTCLLTRQPAGSPAPDWRQVRSFVMRDDFVAQIINFPGHTAITYFLETVLVL